MAYLQQLASINKKFEAVLEFVSGFGFAVTKWKRIIDAAARWECSKFICVNRRKW